ncbi:MAG: transposase [Longimicrobiaceae bacterium]
MDLDRIYRLFPDEVSCLSLLEQLRWRGRPVCPRCGVAKSSPMPAEGRRHCNLCRYSFSVTVNTIFHKHKVELQRWFWAIWLYADQPRNVTTRQLAELVGVHPNTAAIMLARLRASLLEHDRLVQGIIATLASDRNDTHASHPLGSFLPLHGRIVHRS